MDFASEEKLCQLALEVWREAATGAWTDAGDDRSVASCGDDVEHRPLEANRPCHGTPLDIA